MRFGFLRFAILGFTMVEMLVVVFLLGVVIALAIPSVYSSRIRAKGAAESQNLGLIEAAKKEFAMDNPGKDLYDVTRLLRYLPGNRLPKSLWGGDYAT
jgi:prepilin-type N-terminal cleavage/methylation domain-containing protein